MVVSFKWLLALLFGDPNESNEGWHRFLPLVPWITGDHYIVLPLFPIWRRYYPSTDWEGGNWGYGYQFRKPKQGISQSNKWTIGGAISRFLWAVLLGGCFLTVAFGHG
jgi:hypothetical protein